MLHACEYDYSSSTDSQFTENDDEEISFLEACMECDEDALYDIIQDGVTYEQVNERDRSGRVSYSPFIIVLLVTQCNAGKDLDMLPGYYIDITDVSRALRYHNNYLYIKGLILKRKLNA